MALFISVSNGAECKKFLCQTFEAGDDDICVLIDTNETATDELVRNCDKDKTCNAVGWLTPENATENATCANASDPVVNQTLPGDICTESSECFNGNSSTATCSGGICTTTAKNGSECTVGPDEPADYGTRSCPVGTYCDGTQCLEQLGKGEECDSFEKCKTGFACLKITNPQPNRTDTYNCMDYWSLEDGIEFDATYVTRTGFLLTLNDTCSSHHTKVINDANRLFQCRKAPEGNYTTEPELERSEGPTGVCGYVTFDDSDDTTEGKAETDTAKCGFNKGGSAYCNKRKGDSWFQGVFGEVKGKDISGLQCHALSPLSTCLDAANAIGADTYKKWVQELLAVDNNAGYGLYADNDDCVKNSITNEFWQTTPDSAFGSLTLSSFAAMILTISALFYMF